MKLLEKDEIDIIKFCTIFFQNIGEQGISSTNLLVILTLSSQLNFGLESMEFYNDFTMNTSCYQL